MSAQIIKARDLDHELGLTAALAREDPQFWGLSVQGPVLSAAALHTHHEARQMVEEARREAAGIRQRARDLLAEVEALREKQGRDAYEAGLEKARVEITEEVFRVRQAGERQRLELEQQVVDAMEQIFDKLLAREVERGAVLDVVRQALGKTAGSKINVHVNPEDLELLKMQEVELTTSSGLKGAIHWNVDESIGRGGCLVESELATVDARLDQQVAAIKKALGWGE